MANIDQNQLPFYAIKVADIPAEGPIAIPFPISFANNSSYSLDISQLVQQGRISLVQCMFVDNSANDTTISIQIGNPQSLQTIVVPSQSQGYFQILSPNPAKFLFTSQTLGSILVVLLNSPVAGVVWQAK